MSAREMFQIASPVQSAYSRVLFVSTLILDDHGSLFYAAAIPAILLTGISKGGFAGGIGLIAVPMLALVIPPVQAAGILLPILMAMDAIATWSYRNTWDRTNFSMLIPGALVGIAIGTLMASTVPDTVVLLIIGFVSIAFVLDNWFKRNLERPPTQPNIVAGSFWGGIAGFTSFVAHAGSPPFQFYMLPQKPNKTIYVGTSVMFFTSLNIIKLFPYAWLGQLAPGNLWTSAVLLPLAPIGLLTGIWLHNIIDEKPFFRVIYVLIFIVGLKITWDGLSGLFG